LGHGSAHGRREWRARLKDDLVKDWAARPKRNNRLRSLPFYLC
jgi:hypothetical protein